MLSGATAAWADSKTDFEKSIRSLLEKKCSECHSATKQKGDLNLIKFDTYASVTNQPEVWATVLERVAAFEMPPKKSPDLSFEERGGLVAWLRALPKAQAIDCNQLASDRTANFYRGYVMSRRLNRHEFQNTLRDLFGAEIPVLDLLPADGGGGEGFDTSGSALFLSSIHIEKYLAAADRALELVLPDHARRVPQELQAPRHRILSTPPANRADWSRASRDVVSRFAERAWRRSVEPSEVDRLLSLFQRGASRGESFLSSLRMSLRAVLVSPHFLFLAEPEPSQGGIHALAPVPLASKLSYFLWSSMPDDNLMALARSGSLAKPEVYRLQIQRMLADPKATALGERFAIQWLDLERLGTEVRPDPTRFPEFNDALGTEMKQEVISFFNHVLHENRSLLELLQSDYTFVNQGLARLYGLEGISGSHFRKVDLTEKSRGGILGMSAVHAATSYPLRTSPVLRGRWVLEVLLGDKVPPPPPDTPTLDEKTVNSSALTFRQQLEVHRSRRECASCHDKMDPLGFGLENFDVLGRWRDIDKGQPVDSEGTLPSGKKFRGPDGLRSVLMDRKDSVIRHLARKMTGYALGRELNPFDDCVIDRAVVALKENNYRASILVETIATSLPFQNRFYPKQN